MSVVFSFDATFKLRRSSELVIKYRYHNVNDAYILRFSPDPVLGVNFICLDSGSKTRMKIS